VFLYEFTITGVLKSIPCRYGNSGSLSDGNFGNFLGPLFGSPYGPVKKFLSRKGVGKYVGVSDDHVGFQKNPARGRHVQLFHSLFNKGTNPI